MPARLFLRPRAAYLIEKCVFASYALLADGTSEKTAFLL